MWKQADNREEKKPGREFTWKSHALIITRAKSNHDHNLAASLLLFQSERFADQKQGR
jgi:hypothetical protein